MNIVEWLLRRGRLAPHTPALYFGDELLRNYGELSRRTLGLAHALIGRGIRKGDRIGIWMGNTPAYLEVLFAIWAAGAVAVPINRKLHFDEMRDICQSSGAALLFVDGRSDQIGHIPIIDISDAQYEQFTQDEPLRFAVRRNDKDLAWLFYTSGTTGRPKGAMLSFGNLRAMAQAYLVDVDRAAADKAMLYAAPMSHGAGMYALPQTLVGGPHVVPKSGGFDPEEILKLAEGGSLAPLAFFAAPTMVNRLVKTVEARRSAADGIGLIVYGGGPMYAADLELAVSVIGDRFAQIYGQGEAPMTVTHLPRDIIADRAHPRARHRLGSVGIPHNCAEVKITRGDGSEAAVGLPGEILTSGPMVMLGYWQDEEATTNTIVDGWLRTGDIGFLDEDGFLTLTDRSKDVIISGGSNIYPREVEEVLIRHPSVEQVSVVGVQDPEWGEIVIAFVVNRPEAPRDDAELDRHCVAHMARFKRPKAYVFLQDLPKNAYGKVLKTELKETILGMLVSHQRSQQCLPDAQDQGELDRPKLEMSREPLPAQRTGETT